MTETEFTTVGGIVSDLAGRGVVVRARDITDLFYGGLLPGERCPVLAGRRLIPARDLGTGSSRQGFAIAGDSVPAGGPKDRPLTEELILPAGGGQAPTRAGRTAGRPT